MIRAALVALMLAVPATARAQDDPAPMDHGAMDHGVHTMPLPTSAAGAHAGHAMPGAPPTIRAGTPPPIPTDHAADALYDPARMARARAALRRENGGMAFSQLMIDRAEYRAGKGADGYHWEGEGWIGGDIDRLAVKSEGEGQVDGSLERAEVQLLYSRAINPWWNLLAGVRHDIRPQPQRSYATIGIEGLAPYFFELEAQAFLSDKGEAHLRLEGSYDQRITQRLILQPAAEVNIAAQTVPELGIGAGLSTVELGLRLRYEIVREFAPYVGVNWERKVGGTARMARADGDGVSATSLVMGARFWF
ncbi:copper resistance protein B [Sphingobium sp. OAS761]|uniref:copper resistance protein B n=1 Tax=Sphingobium sp. OAS761 TaxID=2817901 RepID=UPI00209D3477|nr:copper resistance protein B [Sphingobium sp. OAS761]MCP1471791.1 copper resistance protein B [Sphingobium sp. OAS761]